MPRWIAVLLALAAVALSGAPAQATPGLPTIVQDDAQLLGRPPGQVQENMRELRSLGVDAVRLSANWSLLAPSPNATRRPAFDASDPASYPQQAWESLDEAVRDARAAGLAVIIDDAFWAPRWAARGPAAPRARTDIDPSEFADFAVAVARRYSGTFTVPSPARPAPPTGGASPPPSPPPPPPSLLGGLTGPLTLRALTPGPLPAVRTYVLWNEPNFPAFLLPQWSGGRPAGADLYRRMVQAAYPAVKAVRPDAAVLIGNTTGSGGDGPPRGSRPMAFIRELACVDRRLRPLSGGVCAHYREVPGDGWAHHPYSNALPEQPSGGAQSDNARIGDLPRLAALLSALVARHRLAPGLASIYITEYGFETQPPSGRARISSTAEQQRQAAVLTAAEYFAQRVPAVRSFAQFLLRDVPPSPTRVSDSPLRGFGQFYSGLLFADGRPKLAVRSFRAGLFAWRRAGSVMVFGRLRLGAGLCRVAVETSTSRGWRVLPTSDGPHGGRTVRSFTEGCQDSFTRYVSDRTPLRMIFAVGRSAWQPGIPVEVR